MVDRNKLSWAKATHIQVNHAEWNSLADTLIEEGYTEITALQKTTKRTFTLGSFKFDDDQRDKSMYAVGWNGELYHFFTADDDEKNDPEHVTGSNAYTAINSQFVTLYKKSLVDAFGTWKRGPRDSKSREEEYHYDLEQCCSALHAIIDCNEFGKHTILSNIYKADISSAYPYQLTKKLPTTNGMRGPLKGAVEPIPGYVAYWVKSGHVIEYGGVDTRKLEKHSLYQKYQKFKAVPADEITYLLPYSEYSLKPIMEELYEGRQRSPRNKGIMNSFVGYLRSRKKWQKRYMGHISALVYARHITQMCEIYDTLIAENNFPLLYATDSIMWAGKESKATTKQKYLGSFTLEYAGCRAIYTACGNYALEEPENRTLAIVKHQGISKDMWAKKNVKTLEDFAKSSVDMLEERYNRKTHRFELSRRVFI